MVPPPGVDAVTGAWLPLLGSAAGIALGYFWGRRNRNVHAHRSADLPGAATPHLLPDPALAWLRRSLGAHGVWAIETKGEAAGARTYQSLNPAWDAAGAELDLLEQRLAACAARDGEGAERMDSGLLLTAAAGGSVVGILLPTESTAALQATARADLAALLDGVGRRPVLHDLAQVQDGLAIESVESVGMRLAYQVERIAGAEAYVASAEPAGVRVIGVSGLADRRTLGQLLPAEAVLARVARGAEPDVVQWRPHGWFRQSIDADIHRHG